MDFAAVVDCKRKTAKANTCSNAVFITVKASQIESENKRREIAQMTTLMSNSIREKLWTCKKKLQTCLSLKFSFCLHAIFLLSNFTFWTAHAKNIASELVLQALSNFYSSETKNSSAVFAYPEVFRATMKWRQIWVHLWFVLVRRYEAPQSAIHRSCSGYTLTMR